MKLKLSGLYRMPRILIVSSNEIIREDNLNIIEIIDDKCKINR